MLMNLIMLTTVSFLFCQNIFLRPDQTNPNVTSILSIDKNVWLCVINKQNAKIKHVYAVV